MPLPSMGRCYTARAMTEARRSPLLDVFASRRMAAMLLLGFASGLPLALSAGSLQAWLTVSGVDIKTIGFFALAGLPYTFKFVWAPLIDRFEPRWLGRRRGWLVLTQLLLAVACFAMSGLDPDSSIQAMGICAVTIAFLSASQDVVFDAYRSDLLTASERGAGAAVSVLGYRLAMLVSGGLALILAEQWLGWPGTFRLMAGLFVVLSLVSLWAPRLADTVRPTQSGAPRTRRLRRHAGRRWRHVAAGLVAALGDARARPVRPPGRSRRCACSLPSSSR